MCYNIDQLAGENNPSPQATRRTSPGLPRPISQTGNLSIVRRAHSVVGPRRKKLTFAVCRRAIEAAPVLLFFGTAVLRVAPLSRQIAPGLVYALASLLHEKMRAAPKGSPWMVFATPPPLATIQSFAGTNLSLANPCISLKGPQRVVIL